MNDEEVKRCDEVKYLGVIVEKQLNWKRHIEQVRKNCLSVLATLYRIRRALPPKVKTLLYLTMVPPRLESLGQNGANLMPLNWTRSRRVG